MKREYFSIRNDEMIPYERIENKNEKHSINITETEGRRK